MHHPLNAGVPPILGVKKKIASTEEDPLKRWATFKQIVFF